MATIRRFVQIEPLAAAMCALPTFLPDLKQYTGRAIQLPGSSWLGPFFTVSVIPDHMNPQRPDVLRTCFANFQASVLVSAALKVLIWLLFFPKGYLNG